jgi:hypothetical protein
LSRNPGAIATSRSFLLLYMPPAPDFVTLQVPHRPVHVQHQVLATLRKIPERDLASQFPVRRTASAHRVAAGTQWIIVHAHVQILSRLLQREKPRGHRRVALGGHAAVVVESDVARDSIRQELLSFILGRPSTYCNANESELSTGSGFPLTNSHLTPPSAACKNRCIPGGVRRQEVHS